MKKDEVVIRDKFGNLVRRVDVTKTATENLEGIIEGLRRSFPEPEYVLDTSGVSRLPTKEQEP